MVHVHVHPEDALRVINMLGDKYVPHVTLDLGEYFEDPYRHSKVFPTAIYFPPTMEVVKALERIAGMIRDHIHEVVHQDACQEIESELSAADEGGGL